MRRLVFHFFITKDWRENKVYDLHFNCLQYYKDCWDEAYFALSTEDTSDTESLLEVKRKLFDIFKDTKRLEFETIQNTPYGEVSTFKKEVIDRLGYDDVVFFAHTKGVTDVIRHHMEPEYVYSVVCGLYYFSLKNAVRKEGVVDEITQELEISTDFLSYGSFMTQFRYKEHVKNRYEWYYAGTFFWINGKRLKHYIQINNIELPEVVDRYYAENFLGHIYPIQLIDMEHESLTLALSYRQRWLYSDTPNYVNLKYHMKFSTEGEEEEFNNFIKEMKGE